MQVREAGEYTLTVARFGTHMTSRAGVFLDYGPSGQEDAPLALDFFFWIARNAHRTVVVDTGFALPAAKRRGRQALVDVAELLTTLNVDPATVETVVLTHAHYDHIGNIGLFPRARFLIASSELAFWRSPISSKPLFRRFVESDELALLDRLESEGRLETFSGHREVAPGIDVYEVGGHTPGQCIVKVATPKGAALLTSDAMHYYEELDEDLVFAQVTDVAQAYQALETIRSMVGHGDIRFLIAGHDPQTLERLREAEGAHSSVAVTVGAAAPTGGNCR